MYRTLFVALGLTLASACTPEEEPVVVEDGAALCVQSDGAIKAVHESCGSACATVNEASCTLDGDGISTLYNYTPPASGEACIAVCEVVESTCGTPTGDTVTFGGETLAVADLPACEF